MNRQKGFTLIELMVVIGIIAILSAIGIPSYQGYLRKAALTDMLQTFVPYRTAIELCAIDKGGVAACNAGDNGIPSEKNSRYISSMQIEKGVVTLIGQETLNGLTVALTPVWKDAEGVENWKRNCRVAAGGSLKQACEEVFRFESETSTEEE
ncbi:prepilin peptidase-dependent pilin [Cedecea colo]|uniref:Prepilin peptidase-dependent pilin n=1 Tax=Cedecea colo TaxID=2552946 RepID=A0ABX0VNW2_9ENTR|nr:prepilin peptidase-dependent pilin [Cedecea colo]NIY48025.1 prepilin peptidase-dependent pilin [Cedecea colo]